MPSKRNKNKSKTGKAVTTSQLSPASNASSSKISDISNNSYASLAATPDPSSDEVEVPSLLDVLKEIRTLTQKVDLVHQQSNKQQVDINGLVSNYANLSVSPGSREFASESKQSKDSRQVDAHACDVDESINNRVPLPKPSFRRQHGTERRVFIWGYAYNDQPYYMFVVDCKEVPALKFSGEAHRFNAWSSDFQRYLHLQESNLPEMLRKPTVQGYEVETTADKYLSQLLINCLPVKIAKRFTDKLLIKEKAKTHVVWTALQEEFVGKENSVMQQFLAVRNYLSLGAQSHEDTFAFAEQLQIELDKVREIFSGLPQSAMLDLISSARVLIAFAEKGFTDDISRFLQNHPGDYLPTVSACCEHMRTLMNNQRLLSSNEPRSPAFTMLSRSDRLRSDTSSDRSRDRSRRSDSTRRVPPKPTRTEEQNRPCFDYLNKSACTKHQQGTCDFIHVLCCTHCQQPYHSIDRCRRHQENLSAIPRTQQTFNECVRRIVETYGVPRSDRNRDSDRPQAPVKRDSSRTLVRSDKYNDRPVSTGRQGNQTQQPRRLQQRPVTFTVTSKNSADHDAQETSPPTPSFTYVPDEVYEDDRPSEFVDEKQHDQGHFYEDQFDDFGERLDCSTSLD